MNTKLIPPLLAAMCTGALGQQTQALDSPMTAAGFACEELQYPAAALRAETTGKTVVAFSVSADGVVNQAEVKTSAGRKREHKLLDFVALQHVRSCKVSAKASVQPGSYSHEFVWLIR